MRLVKDFEVWREANHNAPPLDIEALDEVRAKDSAHPDDLLDLPGIRVKGGYVSGRGYSHFGKLIKFKGEPLRWRVKNPVFETVTDEVVVLSMTDRETVWLGTVAEYYQMWCVD